VSRKAEKGKVLITGIAGFAGSYLAELLLKKGYDISGVLAPGEKISNIRHIKDQLILERFDLTKRDRVSRFINKVKPQYIYHLAAYSSVGGSFSNERLTYDINFNGSLNIFEACTGKTHNIRKIVFVSSADVYGAFQPMDKRLTEKQLLNPLSPYGISKVAAEYLSLYYARQYNLPISIVRPFNHTGPRQSAIFVIPSFCRQIALIEKGAIKPEISVGNLSARRDLSDVRDIVNGYYKIGLKGKKGEIYQLCSGKSLVIKTILEKLLKLSGVKIKVKTDKSRFRKLDIPILKGDYKKAKSKLGWSPAYRLEQTLADSLNYWRKCV